MPRYTLVFPADGSEPYIKGSRVAAQNSGAPMIHGDLPDFVSPIDGKTYSGRTGLRDHCARHDVVPNDDLKGLPTLQSNSDTRSSEQKRADAADRKRRVINLVDKHYY
jgi:hypothetical protein